ncbi:Eaa1 [Klebsiella pneumoniae]|nr:Eaa1 [Klebsiella pneumoniae]
MTKSTITREQLIKKAQEQIEFCRHTKITGEGRAHVNQCAALFEIALAAMDSEPVVKKVACWSCQNEVEIAAISDCDGCCPKCGTRIHLDEEPYIAPLSAPDRVQVRREHAEWSQATFGNVGSVGPLKHLSKEALEAAAEPDDLSEWADMQFLLWDAQRRAGITDEQITQAKIDKLAVNKQREWPEPKDGEPRLHIKEQPAPVVSADLLHTAASAIEDLLEHTDPNTSYYSGVWADVPGKLRAAMFQAKSLTGNSPVIGIDLASGPDRTVEVHYVAPPGYVMVPKEPTEAMMLHNSGCQHHAWDDPDCAMRQTRRLIWSHMLAAAPREVSHD